MKPETAPYRSAGKYVGETAKSYEYVRTSQGRWGFEQEIVRRYVETLQPGSQIADVPFGTGRVAPFYIKQRLKVFGGDISEDMLEIARNNVGDAPGFQIQVAAAEALPLQDQSVDHLICHRFIKWLSSSEVLGKVLEEFARVTRKEIFVQVRVEEPKWLKDLRRMLQGKPRKMRGKKEGKIHSSKFTARDIRRAVRAAGLRITRVEEHPEVSEGVAYYTLERR